MDALTTSLLVAGMIAAAITYEELHEKGSELEARAVGGLVFASALFVVVALKICL